MTVKDTLTIRGVAQIDGTYEFDLAEMLTAGHPASLTSREGHRIKTMSGVRIGELEEALEAGDNDVMVALAAIVLTRHGKRFDESLLWDAPMGAAEFAFPDREEKGDGDEEVPPVDGRQTPSPETSGGGSSRPVSVIHPESDPSPTGTPVSDMSAISARATSAT